MDNDLRLGHSDLLMDVTSLQPNKLLEEGVGSWVAHNKLLSGASVVAGLAVLSLGGRAIAGGLVRDAISLTGTTSVKSLEAETSGVAFSSNLTSPVQGVSRILESDAADSLGLQATCRRAGHSLEHSLTDARSAGSPISSVSKSFAQKPAAVEPFLLSTSSSSLGSLVAREADSLKFLERLAAGDMAVMPKPPVLERGATKVKIKSKNGDDNANAVLIWDGFL